MNGARDARVWLYDIQTACRHILDFTRDRTVDEYRDSIMLRSAVERQFLIAGEALRRMVESEPAASAAIRDVARIIGFRNRLAHGYEAIDDAVVWGIVERHVPGLLEDVTELLAGYPDPGP